MKEATRADVDQAVEQAQEAFATFAADREKRAQLLEAIAEQILGLGDELLDRAHEESALPLTRLMNERGRTVGQLRLFAEVVREGAYLGVRVEAGDPGRQPQPKPDLRRMLRPLGPVAVFGASNFPLAFSVAGGDTASALAAGCPVIHKAHPAHPETAALVGGAVDAAVAAVGLPAGVFSLLHGGSGLGAELASHPGIRAIGFTGSVRGGRAIFDLAAARPRPIPVYAEMGSVNPVFLLPGAVEERAAAIAAGLAGSVTLGVGQFCTNPGLVFLVGDEQGEALLATLKDLMNEAAPGRMLHPALTSGYQEGVERHLAHGVEKLTDPDAIGGLQVKPMLLATRGEIFAANEALQEEIFGPVTLAVRCRDEDEMIALAGLLGGQLTATLHAAEGKDDRVAAVLLEILADRAGRLVWNGYPTGVEVCHAMQHGGPYPATTDSRSTSVGTAAIDRFLRPVAFQDLPDRFLPAELRSAEKTQG